MIALCEPCLVGNAEAYVRDCVTSGWVSSVGSYVTRFEQEVAARVGAAHGVALVNGTAALHLALVGVGVHPGDEVLVSALTFVASANAIRHAGAHPVFIDAEPEYWQMDPELLTRFLADDCEPRDGRLHNRATGRPIGAIMPVHILGHPVDLDPVLEAAQRYGIPVVEDAAEGFAATYHDRHVGHLGRVGALSFNGNKLLTTGGGGMALTDDPELAAHLRHLSTQAKLPGAEYDHDHVGYNYRLTNLAAALGCAQLEQLDTFLAAKRRIAETYAAALAALPGLGLPREAPWARSSWWLYTVRVDAERFGMGSRALMACLAEREIQTRPLWRPLPATPAYADCQTIGGKVAETLCRDGLSLPCSAGLQPDQQQHVITAIREAVRNT